MTLAVAAPASAAEPEFLKPLGWYAETTAMPTSVAFNDVAAVDGLEVAVGADTGQPVIYNRTGGSWQPAPVEPSLPAAGTLTDVVLSSSGDAGWAVGTADGQPPLVLELVNGVWTDRSTIAALPAAPTAVGLTGIGAIIGDDAGNIRYLSAGGTASQPQEAASAGAINGVSASPGIAVAERKSGDALWDKGARIYELREQPLLEANEQTRTPAVDMAGLAAAAANHAVAFDSTTNSTWRLTIQSYGNDWIQESAVPNASALSDVASVNGGPSPWGGTGWATEFLAGSAGDSGAIWHRTRWAKDGAAWNADPVPAGTPALSGVAATAWNDAWAVGTGGTILHYWRPPDPEAEAAWRAQQQQQQQQQQSSQQQNETSTTGGTQEQTGPQQTSIVTIGEWRPSGSSTGESGGDRLVTNGIVVEDGDDTPTPARKRLVKNVRAIFSRTRTGRRKLIITFRLTRRAQVSVAAKRGRTVIGRTRMQTLRAGRRRVILPVRGKEPPTSLKLLARPVRRAT